MRSIKRTLAMCILAVAVGAPVTALAQQDPEGSPQGSQLETTRAGDLVGKKVYNEAGDEIGKVDSIVRDKKTHQVEAVIDVGGFLSGVFGPGGVLGIGEHKVTIALEDLGKRGDDLLAPAGTTKDKLESMPQYDESNYERVTLGTHGGSR